MNIGLTMIAKNAGQDLRLCLASAAPIVSQIVIVDTGATGDTRTIAAEFGATVIPFQWNDHFAEARNAGLRELKTGWVLILDVDEELEPGSAAKIAGLLDHCGETVAGFNFINRHYMPTRFVHTLRSISMPNNDHNPRALNAPSYVESMSCRLFRRHPGIFYTGRVHEKVEQPIHSLGMTIQPSDVRVLHYGRLVSHADRHAKDLYYYRLCRRKAEEEPQNVEIWLELGLVAFENINDYAASLQYLGRAVQIQPDLPIAWLVMALIHLKGRRYLEVLDASDHVPDAPPLSMLKQSARGDAFHGLKRLKEAQRAYRKALEICRKLPELQSCSLLTDLESRLGFTNVGLGLVEPGLDRLRRAAIQTPNCFETQDRLMRGYLLAGQIEAAAQTSADIARLFRAPRLYVRSAAIQIRAGQADRARTCLDEAATLYPADPDIARIRRELSAL